jgi:hypothetical protein
MVCTRLGRSKSGNCGEGASRSGPWEGIIAVVVSAIRCLTEDHEQ